MAKLLFAVVAAVASLIAVESLICNKCSFNLLGVCVNPTEETCAVNGSVCYTGRSNFPVLPGFVGFNVQGCRNNDTGCGAVTSGTMMGVTYNSNVTCCSADRCNPVALSAAPSTKVTFSAAVGGAVLATVWGSLWS